VKETLDADDCIMVCLKFLVDFYMLLSTPTIRGDEVSDTWQLSSAIQDEGDDDQTLWNDYSRLRNAVILSVSPSIGCFGLSSGMSCLY
jgi:hypothetical protein